jgi:radical SAM superfamily enzyme YgiQ (UPF0313 family)
MRVVLVHGRYANSWEAQGLGWIASYVKRHRPDVEFEFFQGCFDSDADIVAAGARADVVAFSCTTPSFAHAARLAAAIHEQNDRVRTVIGGYHASALPDACLAAGFDQAVVGEGEAAMLDVVNGNRSPIVRGGFMAFKDLPWPNRRLIRNERNIEVAARENGGRRITSFQSARACPFSCKYCADGAEKALYGGDWPPIRRRTVYDLLDEIAAVAAEYRLDFFKFCDGTWNSCAPWVKDFSRAKLASPVAALPFFANLHAALVDEESLALMVEAGCTEIGIGVESGSAKILKLIGKGTTRESIARACALVKRAGLHARGYFILGVPEETEEDLAQTEAFAEALDLDEYGFTILCPYPGSSYFARDPGRFAGIRWEETDEYRNDFWHAETVSNERLRDWQRRLTERFQGRLTQRQPETMEVAR